MSVPTRSSPGVPTASSRRAWSTSTRSFAGGKRSDLVFFSSRRRHTRFDCDWSSDVCSSDLLAEKLADVVVFLQEGRVTLFGPWDEFENSSDPFIRNFRLQDELIPALDVTL